jgi:hypothetical protein
MKYVQVSRFEMHVTRSLSGKLIVSNRHQQIIIVCIFLVLPAQLREVLHLLRCGKQPCLSGEKLRSHCPQPCPCVFTQQQTKTIRVVLNVLCHKSVIATTDVSSLVTCSAVMTFQLLTATNNSCAEPSFRVLFDILRSLLRKKGKL